MYIPPPTPNTRQGKAAHEMSPFWRALNALGAPSRYVGKHVTLPIAQAFTNDPETRDRYQELRDSPGNNVWGGDILRAGGAFEGLPGPDWGRNLAYGLGGTLLDAGADPLTYTGIGALTKMGKGLEAIPRLNKLTGAIEASRELSLAGQVAKGQRSVLSFAGRPLPGSTGKLASNLMRPLDAIQQAQLAQRVVGLLPKSHVLQTAAQVVDKGAARFAHLFGVPLGVDPVIAQGWKRMNSAILGQTGHGARMAMDHLPPVMEALETDLVERLPRLGVTKTRQEIRDGLGNVLSSLLEEHPELKVVGSTVQHTPLGGPRPMANWKDVATAMSEEFLPPTWGGPASPWDTQLMRDLRGAALLNKAKLDDVLKKELRMELDSHRLVSSQSQSYYWHMETPEFRDAKQAWEDVSFGAGRAKSSSSQAPSTSHGSQILATLRMIHPEELAKMQANNHWAVAGGVGGKLQAALGGVPDGASVKTVFERMQEKLAPLAVAEKKAWVRNDMNHVQLMQDAQQNILREVGELLPRMSAKDANTWIASNGLGEMIRPGQIKQAFRVEPDMIMAGRTARGDRAILSKEFFNEIKQTSDAVVDEATRSANMAKYGHYVQAQHPELVGQYIEPETSRWMNKMRDLELKGPQGFMKPFLKFVDGYTRWWKAWTLAVFPTYHMRNFVGNAWNLFLGADNPATLFRDGPDAERVFKALGDGTHNVRKFKVNGQTVSANYLWQGGMEHNLWGEGLMGAETGGGIETLVKGMRKWGAEDPEYALTRTWRKANTRGGGWGYLGLPPEHRAEGIKNLLPTAGTGDSWWIDGGFRVGKSIENRARMTHFLQKLREGAPLTEAAMSVKKHLFDYRNLAPFEQQTWARVFPFYAWSRNNVPFQIESMLTRPGKFARFGSFIRGTTGPNNPAEESFVQDYMIKQMPMRVRKDPRTGRYEYFLFKNWLPAADIIDILQPLDWMTNALNPLPKTLIEQATNTSLFTDKQIDRLDSVIHGERATMFKVDMPRRVHQVLRGFRVPNTMSQFIDNPQDVSLANNLLRFAFGRVYPLDPAKGMQSFQQKLEDMDLAARRSMTSVALNKKMTPEKKQQEIQRLSRTLLEKRQTFMKSRGM